MGEARDPGSLSPPVPMSGSSDAAALHCPTATSRNSPENHAGVAFASCCAMPLSPDSHQVPTQKEHKQAKKVAEFITKANLKRIGGLPDVISEETDHRGSKNEL